MAGPYYIDSLSGGDTDGLSWANAWISPNSLPTLADGEIVYIASDSVDAFTYTAHKIIQGPSTGAARIVSVTGGTTTYATATTDQFKITGASTYDITFDGGFNLQGIQVNNTKGDVILKPQAMEEFWAEDCQFTPAHGSQIQVTGGTKYTCRDCTFDCSNDTTGSSTGLLSTGSVYLILDHCTFSNGSNRTGSIFVNSSTFNLIEATGCDFSSFTNATECEVIHENSNNMNHHFYGCKFKTSWVWESTSTPPRPMYLINAVNCGSSGDSPEYLYYATGTGRVTDSAVNRTGGASIEGTNVSWGPILTEAICDKNYPFFSPWIYPVPIGTTGSKTFTVHVQNNTGDTTDTEQWLEVQVKETASSSVWTTVTGRNSDHFASGTANTDDTGSTWSSSQTYHQKLSVTVTVNTVGIYRARVAYALASIATSENYYIDPLVVVS